MEGIQNLNVEIQEAFLEEVTFKQMKQGCIGVSQMKSRKHGVL